MKLTTIHTLLATHTRASLESLFIQLGWDRPQHQQVFTPTGVDELTPIAQKRSYMVFEARCATMPDKNVRNTIEQAMFKQRPNKLIIFVAGAQRIWQFSTRDAQRKRAIREFVEPGDTNLLATFLARMEFGLDQEESLTLVDVLQLLNPLAEVERVTKKFYDEFKKQHDVFMNFINGIPDEQLQRWYASVMLNRLMFIYFLQKKQFVAGDVNYLKNNLEKQSTNYYQEFLCPLFFEGFAKRPAERAPDVSKKLGNVPYLNGGIFNQHQIETLHGQQITIADEAFVNIFTFFDGWTWHLDDRPLSANSNEINPDVLGYIFEKYINQRQMGAYYTKEDITEYICRSTIVPFLIDIVVSDADWQLLADDPERYIFAPVRHGLELPLPEHIAVGVDTVARRERWNDVAPASHALPTEIWRETVARRQRAQQLIDRMRAGELRTSNQLITDNLDVRQFLQDVIARADSTRVMKLWERLQTLSVLDPTVGSGAFLFAALNILHPIYDACLDRMAVLKADDGLGGYADAVNVVLADIKTHRSQTYTILKRIMVNNLYGVDIMEEAVEICKLRLFLKLTAQITQLGDLEPLPDIDFNIRAGNTLVGYARLADAQTTAENTNIDMDLFGTKDTLRTKLEALAQVAQRYRDQQSDMGATYDDKKALTAQLAETAEALNQRLAALYGVDVRNQAAYTKWLKSHEPFHWCSEFYTIIEERGGFDVIVGNPPYVEYSKVRGDYKVQRYVCESAGNLYAFVIERCFSIAKYGSLTGMIIQLSAFCTPRMNSFQELWMAQSKHSFVASFDDRPGKLFDGLDHIRVAICISERGEPTGYVGTTGYTKFYTENRDLVFDTIRYAFTNKSRRLTSILKLSSHLEAGIVDKIWKNVDSVDNYATSSENLNFLYYGSGFGYFGKVLNFRSYFMSGTKNTSTGDKFIYFQENYERDVFVALINSTLFYWFYVNFGDGHNLTKYVIGSLPFTYPDKSKCTQLKVLVDELMEDMKSKSYRKKAFYKASGNVEYDEYYPKKSKHIIDEIDRVLAQHYGFTDEELDYIINYDIKYRMGLVGSAGDEGE
jgi:hypothetical protein